jgi:MFS family permease
MSASASPSRPWRGQPGPDLGHQNIIDQGPQVAVATDIPARLDALPWSGFHTRVVVALGITWILDGLEVTLAGSLSGALRQGSGLGLSNSQIGQSGSAYLAGAVLGALLFGWLTDRLGRRKLFFVTIGIYVTATALTGLAWSFASFAAFRFLTGAGIGGEYTAINSTIQELIPARLRGRTDLTINGTFWIGAALGAGGSIVLLDAAIIDPAIGWRLAFLIGAGLGVTVFIMRLWIPESPRWLVTHGDPRRADAIASKIERQSGAAARQSAHPVVRLKTRTHSSLVEIGRALFRTHRQRTLVGLSLMGAQAFFYNAIFFTYALILTDFYGVAAGSVGWYILPFAAGNFLGPIVLGPLFDTIGRKQMIAMTYMTSGILLSAAGYLFSAGLLSVEAQTVIWMIIFFFGSAAASSAYLTAGEIFPLEIRAVTIAFFYATGTAVGGLAGPWLFGALLDTGSRARVADGYYLGAALMIAAALVAWRWGVAAERKSLESVCKPLGFID